jgi:predicted 2-oxoglutarate/Fe(II)-dependent dioxygenase YbiX
LVFVSGGELAFVTNDQAVRASDLAIQQLAENPVALSLTGVYHNLLRRWADI